MFHNFHNIGSYFTTLSIALLFFFTISFFTISPVSLHASSQLSVKGEVNGLIESATTIATGYHHTCAVTSAGGAKCWGANEFGQLGNGTRINTTTPINVVTLSSGVSAIAAGYYHTCALTNAGGVKCWGRNVTGQLGDGTKTDQATPVDVVGLSSGVIAITARWNHTCALTASGTAKCWGYNFYGGLGDGTNTDRAVPINVAGLDNGVSAIAAGQYHTCAITNAGGVKCWGQNLSGQLGNGTNIPRSLTPVDVVGLDKGVNSITSGWSDSCVVTNMNVSKCWGRNSWTPGDVPGLSNEVSRLASGDNHTCALTNTGGVKCWGSNASGQLGDNTDLNRFTPGDVIGLSTGVNVIAAGYLHTCAVSYTGKAQCWGNHTYGQLGVGATSTPRIFAPLNVVGLGGVSLSATGATTGTVGSNFIFSSTGFMPTTTFTVYLDRVTLEAATAAVTPIGETTSDNNGNFTLTLVTNEQTPVGSYRLKIGNAQSSFAVAADAELHQPTPQGSLLQVPDRLNEQEIFLPLVRR